MLEAIVGLRKLIVSIVILGVAVAVAYIKGDVPPGLVNILGLIFGGFVVGNAVEHITDGSIEKASLAQQAATENSTPTASEEQVKALEAKIDATALGVDNVQNALMLIINKYRINE